MHDSTHDPEPSEVPERTGTSGSPFAADGDGRRRIRESLDESLLVEAAAGTGKTTVLVDRLVQVLAEGRARVDRVVAVTFTRKAAGELKLRLRQGLDRAYTACDPEHDQERRQRLSAAVARLEEAHIGTIHSFCAELLRRRPVEAGVDPAFREMDEEESASLYEQAFRSWIEERLNDLPPGLERALRRLAAQPSGDGSSPIERLMGAGRQLVDWRDFDTPWQRLELDLAMEIDRLIDLARSLFELRAQGKPHDPLFQSMDGLEDFVAWVERSDALAARRDYAEIEALLLQLLRDLRWKDRRTGRTTHFAPNLARRDVIEARDRLIGELAQFERRAGADLAHLLQQELGDVLVEYEALKLKSGRLDFLDLLVRCRDLLRDHGAARRYFQGLFDCLFVDELQDTDPLQAEILLLLSADDAEEVRYRHVRPVAGKLFLVGDPKQSIYRFRRADVLLYQGLAEQLAQAGVDRIHLSRSFRATQPLQTAVNDAFRHRMRQDTRAGQADYVPLEGDRPETATRPSLIALPAPAPFGYRNVSKKEVEACMPETVAAFVHWLVQDSGWTVEDPEGSGPVPIQPRHVCLIFRRFMSWGRDVTAEYLQHLESRGVDHVLVGGRSFHQREEVESLRAALTAIEWPDDTLAVYATLRGELFGFADDALLRYLNVVGPLHPLAAGADPGEETGQSQGTPSEDLDEELEALGEALLLLADLHRRRNEVPIAQTLNRLLTATRAQAGFAFRPAGNQVLVNVQRIIDMARGFEVRGGLSFRGFVEHLDDAAKSGAPSASPMLEEGAEGVRLMTAHAAKGLEFPVVILADPTCNLAGKEPSRFLDAERRLCAQKILGCSPEELLANRDTELERDRAEAVRLAYVAATRARDLLVVSAVGAEPLRDGWLSPLDDVIYPERTRYVDAAPAPGCPRFGSTTVLRGPREFDPHAPPPVRPGLHQARGGGPGVVWWDPAALRLGVKGNFGVRHHKLLAPDPGGVGHEQGLDAFLDWEGGRSHAVERGREPSCEVIVVTETEQMPPGARAKVDIVRLERPDDRPSGKRFGTLVHTVLRDVALDAAEETRSSVDRLTRLHGRLLAATAEEQDAARQAVLAALGHDTLKRAAAADEVQRELPFVLPYQERYRIEGVLDLAFREGERWIVVDFKTDAELEDRATAYERQIAWYAFALEQLTGQSAEGVLLAL